MQEKMKELQKEFRNNIQQEVNRFTDKIQSLKLKQTRANNQVQIILEREKKNPIEKIFYQQQSLLTLMMEIKDYKTLYIIAVTSFICLTTSLIMNNYVETGQFFDFTNFAELFRGRQQAFFFWLKLACWSYLIIPITIFTHRFKIKSYIWIPFYIVYLLQFFYFPYNFVINKQSGFCVRCFALAESFRMLMKSHSYLRNKLLYGTQNSYANQIPQFLKEKLQDQKKPQIKIQSFQNQLFKYSYFFFCPTLIYRDQYILKHKRSIKTIIIHSLNFIYSFIMYKLFCQEQIRTMKSNLNLVNFIIGVLRMMLPSMFFLNLMFFGVLHSWMNAWAQFTRFPDRAFYLDWWNCTEFGSYYRKWNILVHDFLYYYLYIDLIRFSKGKIGRKTANLLTFLISAIIHQFIIMYSIKFFFPFLFILFIGPGVLLIQGQKKMKNKNIKDNLFFWMEMYLGTSLIFILYLTEYEARLLYSDQYMKKQWGWLEPIIPRMLILL